MRVTMEEVLPPHLQLRPWTMKLANVSPRYALPCDGRVQAANGVLAAICSAFRTPTSRHKPRPGPTVTATAVQILMGDTEQGVMSCAHHQNTVSCKDFPSLGEHCSGMVHDTKCCFPSCLFAFLSRSLSLSVTLSLSHSPRCLLYLSPVSLVLSYVSLLLPSLPPSSRFSTEVVNSKNRSAKKYDKYRFAFFSLFFGRGIKGPRAGSRQRQHSTAVRITVTIYPSMTKN